MKNPVVLFLLQWIVLMVSYHLFMSDLQSVSLIFYLILIDLIGCMFLGQKLAELFPVHLPDFPKIVPVLYLYVFAFVILIYTLYSAYRMGAGFDSFLDFRDSLFYTDDDERGSIQIGISFPMVAAALFLSRIERRQLMSVFWAFGLFLLAVVSTSKMYLFLSVFFLLPKIDDINFKKISSVVLVLILMFGLSHLILEKFSSDPEDGVLDALFKTFQVYLLSGIGAFQLVLDGFTSLPEMRSLYGVKQIIPLNIFSDIRTNIYPFVALEDGWMTNVYTAIGPWWFDFGFLGVGVIGAGIGYFYTLLWTSRRNFSLYLFSFSVLPLFFTFFEDYFLMSLKTWVAFIVVAFVVEFISVRKGVKC